MKKKYSYIGISFVILLFGIYVVPKVVKKFQKSDLVTFNKVPEFEFINHNGNTITNKNFEGKVFVVEFFFTTCPSICPIMNQKMIDVQNKFYGNPNFGIASFSITPNIDTPEVLNQYRKEHNITSANWQMLTGKSQEYVYDLSNKGFKLYAGNGDGEHGGFEHSGLFALIDKEGNIRSRRDPHGNPIMYYRALEENGFADQIAELKEDIKILLNE
ncbi:SCO family protein [Polaribacter gochangensis]|uniref:SCO family protein n=1 Tax=Polaribacter gochangensis TaxID=3252903 RepID=UPI003904A6BC